MAIVKRIQAVSNYLKGLQLVKSYPVKGVIDKHKHISEITSAPHRHIARQLVASVYTRWRRNIGIGSLCTDKVGFKDISVILPDGDSRDYVREVKKFTVEVFGQYPPWKERDEFLQKLQPDLSLRGLRFLLFHPFLRNPEQRLKDLSNFVDSNRHTKLFVKNIEKSWKDAFGDWEAKYFPSYMQNIEVACKRNTHTLMVYKHGIRAGFYNPKTKTYSHTGSQSLIPYDAGKKVIISRNIAIHLDDHVVKKSPGSDLYTESQRYTLVEELFDDMHLLLYEFRWYEALDGGISELCDDLELP